MWSKRTRVIMTISFRSPTPPRLMHLRDRCWQLILKRLRNKKFRGRTQNTFSCLVFTLASNKLTENIYYVQELVTII